jgi:hypothetical protein
MIVTTARQREKNEKRVHGLTRAQHDEMTYWIEHADRYDSGILSEALAQKTISPHDMKRVQRQTHELLMATQNILRIVDHALGGDSEVEKVPTGYMPAGYGNRKHWHPAVEKRHQAAEPVVKLAATIGLNAQRLHAAAGEHSLAERMVFLKEMRGAITDILFMNQEALKSPSGGNGTRVSLVANTGVSATTAADAQVTHLPPCDGEHGMGLALAREVSALSK